MSTVRIPQKSNIKRNNEKSKSGTKKQVTNEIALLSQESIDSASQNSPTIHQTVVDETNIVSHIELAASDLTRVSNKPELSRQEFLRIDFLLLIRNYIQHLL